MQSNPADITMGEPVLVNPNSFDNIKTILDNIKSRAITVNGRKWVFVGADGPPYCLMRRLIAEDPDKYNWLSIVSGLGHLNLNQVKTFFKICDKVVLDVLGQDVLKFYTAKSYQYFLDCKDNHKAWQSFEIFLHGSIMELIRIDFIVPIPLKHQQ